jgi:MFS family permease
VGALQLLRHARAADPLHDGAPVAAGGLGFDTAVRGAVYGLYTSMVYMTTLPGGWIADRLIGQRRAVLYGGIIIAAGHFSMAVPSLTTFYHRAGADRRRHRCVQRATPR